VRQLWPILLAFLFGREGLKSTLLYVVIGISVLVLIYSIISFFKYYFYIEGDELIVEKGVFQKSKTNISFERIQTVNFEQSVLHQLFDVVKLEIDTAGSKGNEFSFAALDKGIASEMRDLILKRKEAFKESMGGGRTEEAQAELDKQENVVMSLSLSELIRIGFVQNHLRSFFLIIFFFLWIVDQMREIGMDPEEMIGELDQESIEYGWSVFGIFMFFAILVSLIISLVRTVMRYYEFSLVRTSDGFKVKSGLFNRKQVSARDHKIQIVSWADNPLKRLLKIHDVFLKQASSVQVQNKLSIVIPGCDRQNLEKIKNYYFEEEEWKDMHDFAISPLFIVRRMLFLGLIPFFIMGGVLWWQYSLGYASLAILWLPLMYYSSLIAYRKRTFSVNQHIIHIRKGLFGNYHKTLRLYKIQNVHLRRGIYHRLNDLADISIYTASGRVGIPFVPLELATKLVDFMIYKIETDKRNWM
jgi:putative membrane protein